MEQTTSTISSLSCRLNKLNTLSNQGRKTVQLPTTSNNQSLPANYLNLFSSSFLHFEDFKFSYPQPFCKLIYYADFT